MPGTASNSEPRVSVLMPVYNSAPYVRDAVDCIRRQRFADFELIVLDDGSNDGSTELLNKAAGTDRRIRVIVRANRGIVATRNQLLHEARGELIAWMDSDDLCDPERLQMQVAAFDADPNLVCVGSNVQLIDPEGKPLGIETYPSDHAGIATEQQSGGGLRFASTMQRRSVASGIGGFRQFPIGEDFDFLLRVGERGKMANLPDRLYTYRQHLKSTCTAFGANWGNYRETILSLARERREQGSDRLQRGHAIVFPEPASEDARKHRHFVFLEWGKGALMSGDRKRAFRYTLRAIGAAPTKQAGWRFLAKLMLQPPTRA